MDYIKELESGSSPRIATAAKKIIKNKLTGYCPHLLNALTQVMKKPQYWNTQCQVIKAIGMTNCIEGLPLIKEFINQDYEHTVLYKELAFAIFMLENINGINLSFLFESIDKGNDMQISGCCAALFYKKIIPNNDDIKKIIIGISPYVENEGQIITPRCYIAAAAQLWPKEVTKDFLQECKKSKWPGLIDIAENSLLGKISKIQLV
ncbi:MAG: hypothetical protein GXY06_09645 [Clostridiaceae bacterium]|nr:hypothetical protein [Clostridiaceae bacterium]